MKVNNIDISVFKAKLMDRVIKPANFEVINFWINSINPIIKPKNFHKYKEIDLKFDIICENANELEVMKSNLTKQLELCTIRFDDINYYYVGFGSEVPQPNYIMQGNETLDIKLLVYCCGDEVTELISRINSKTINVPGNLETPAIVEIMPSIDIIDIVITGLGDTFTIKNLKAGQKVIVDGELGVVTQNGVNKFLDFVGWEFPKLTPGANTITFSKSNCDIIIKYKPRWI